LVPKIQTKFRYPISKTEIRRLQLLSPPLFLIYCVYPGGHSTIGQQTRQ
jgi:hypothetical protein